MAKTTLEEWLSQLRGVIANSPKLSENNKNFYLGLAVDENKEGWRPYWEDGYTPEEALDEDLTYAY